MTSAPSPHRLVVRAALLVGLLVKSTQLIAQAPPDTLARVALPQLAGEWYEIATTGTFWHRRCVSNTRYRFSASSARRLVAVSVCTTARGVETHRGRLRAAPGGDGRLSIRFAPGILAWLPATWADFWILAMDEETGWLLVGDNRRQRLTIAARTVELDEASMAHALAAARQAGYDISPLAPVPHPAGATGLPIR